VSFPAPGARHRARPGSGGERVAETYPQYYVDEQRPVVFAQRADGGLDVLALSPETGGFERDKSYAEKIWLGTTANSETVSREEFVQRVEEYRRRHLTGEGPVFAVYETIAGVLDNARAAGRWPTDEGKALVPSLRAHVHELFEADLRGRGLIETPEES
jgi:hypothetical protein